MVFQNMINLAIPSVDSVVKVGDTMADVRRRMTEAGAHYVIDRMAELPKIIDEINKKMIEL